MGMAPNMMENQKAVQSRIIREFPRAFLILAAVIA